MREREKVERVSDGRERSKRGGRTTLQCRRRRWGKKPRRGAFELSLPLTFSSTRALRFPPQPNRRERATEAGECEIRKEQHSKRESSTDGFRNCKADAALPQTLTTSSGASSVAAARMAAGAAMVLRRCEKRMRARESESERARARGREGRRERVNAVAENDSLSLFLSLSLVLDCFTLSRQCSIASHSLSTTVPTKGCLLLPRTSSRPSLGPWPRSATVTAEPSSPTSSSRSAGGSCP